MRASVERGNAVYVHCWGGIGRTGTVVGCWLVETGGAGDDVLEAIKALRAGTMKRSTQFPETSDQAELHSRLAGREIRLRPWRRRFSIHLGVTPPSNIPASPPGGSASYLPRLRNRDGLQSASGRDSRTRYAENVDTGAGDARQVAGGFDSSPCTRSSPARGIGPRLDGRSGHGYPLFEVPRHPDESLDVDEVRAPSGARRLCSCRLTSSTRA